MTRRQFREILQRYDGFLITAADPPDDFIINWGAMSPAGPFLFGIVKSSFKEEEQAYDAAAEQVRKVFHAHQP